MHTHFCILVHVLYNNFAYTFIFYSNCLLLYALVGCELGCDAEVFEVAMEEGVEELREDISPVELEVLLGSEPLLRLKVDHTANHTLRKWLERLSNDKHYAILNARVLKCAVKGR